MYQPKLGFTPTMCYILGVIRGDGSVYSGYQGSVKLNVIDKVFAESFAQALIDIGIPTRVILGAYSPGGWLCGWCHPKPIDKIGTGNVV